MRNLVTAIIVLFFCSAAWAAPADEATEVIPINYTTVDKVMELCQSVFPNLRCQAGERKLFLTGTRNELQMLEAFVNAVDVAPTPDPVESQVCFTRYATAEALLPLCRFCYPDVHYETDNGLVKLTGKKSTIAAARRFISTFDDAPRRILLAVRILSLDDRGTKELFFHNAVHGGLPFGQRPALTCLCEADLAALHGASTVAARSGSALTFHESTMFLGDDVPVSWRDPHNRELKTGRADIGVGFTVTPYLSNDGFITMFLKYHANTLTTLPLTGTPSAQEASNASTFRVRPGQVILIANLLTAWEGKSSGETHPWLAELPVLGALFRNAQPTLIVTITPTLAP